MSITIQESVRRAEKLSKKEAARLEKLLGEITEANPSMPPEIYQPDETIELDTAHGGQSIDGDVIGAEGMKELKKLAKEFDAATEEVDKAAIEVAIYDLIGDYMEATLGTRIYSIEIVSGGWIAHLSMPGYMDQTEPTRYDTLKEAIEELHSQFADIG